MPLKGQLYVRDNFCTTGPCFIAVHKSITFGENVLVSWDCSFIDTDFHNIVDGHGVVLNPDSDIKIGNSVWFGHGCTVLKGTEIEDNNVIASKSLLNKKYLGSNLVLAGVPARCVKDKVSWVR